MSGHGRKLVIGLVFLAGLSALSVAAVRFGAVSALLFFLRVPFFFGLFLVLFPIVAVSRAGGAMLRNLFVHDCRLHLMLAIVSTFFAASAVTTAFDSILRNAPLRFELLASLMRSDWQLNPQVHVLSALLLCTTHIGVTYRLSKRDTRAVIDICAGVILGLSVMLGLKLLYDAHLPLDPMQWLTVMLGEHNAGYLNEDGVSLKDSHSRAALFALISLCIYVPLGWLERPGRGLKRLPLPSLVYLNILVTCGCLIFAGATFYFDFLHVPVFAGFGLVCLTSYYFFRPDHYYAITEPKTRVIKPYSEDFGSLLQMRLAHQSDDKHLVVICCSGGGIQASAWSARVMSGLATALGPSFTRSIVLVSSVSGGSIGSLFFLDRLSAQGSLSPNDAAAVFANASADALSAVGWGLAYPDLFRIAGLPWVFPPELDRGSAMEAFWKTKLRADDKQNPYSSTFACWRNDILAGRLPIPAFNATLVESGNRFIYSPVSFSHPNNVRCEDFFAVYQGADIDAVTAARMSATFPYVSPIAKNTPLPGLPDYHVADGGFFDNYGVFTALEWIRNQLIPLQQEQRLNIKNILFLEIEAFDDRRLPQKLSAMEGGGLSAAWVGPLKVLAHARGATQTARNRMEVDMMKQELLARGINMEVLRIVFPTLAGADRHYRPPLSWKLSAAEKKVVWDAWDSGFQKSEHPLNTVKRLWQLWGC